jgi:hypothetical protein
MLREFDLMSKAGVIGHLAFDTEKDIWRFIYNPEYKGDAPTFIKKGIINNADISSYDIKDWVCGRAPEPNYQLIGNLMREIGIVKYDPVAFFLAYDGRMNSDEFYVVSKNREVVNVIDKR